MGMCSIYQQRNSILDEAGYILWCVIAWMGSVPEYDMVWYTQSTCNL
jgi:hypothetical protein